MRSPNMNSLQPIAPNTILELGMEAQEWNLVLEIICRSTGFPYVQTAPLIEKLGKQMQEKAERRGLQEVRDAS